MHSPLLSLAVLVLSAFKFVRADFVHIVQDVNGVFWFEQNGARFTSRVVNHVNNGGPDDGVGGRESAVCRAATNNTLCGDSLNFGGALGYAPYWNVVQGKFNASVDAWADATISRLATLGFNGVSGWSAEAASASAQRHGGFASFQLLDAGVTWPDAWSKGLDDDVFSTNFSAQVERVVAAAVQPRANDESLLAWQTDNECNYMRLGLITYLTEYADGAGGATCITWLQSRFGSLAALNAAFNSSASAWTGPNGVGAALVNDKGLNASAVSAANVDFIANAVMDRYFNLTTTAIRRYDTNHLISGLRGYFGNAAMEVMIVAARYIDILDFHDYSDLPDIATMALAHSLTGKPIVNGEFSFTAVDSNMPNTHGARAGNPEPTQTDRARKFTAYATLLMSQSYAIGFGWWNWVDEPSTGRWPDGENSNYGVVALSDDVYSILGDAFTQFALKCDELHAGSASAADL